MIYIARTRKQDREQKPFVLPNTETKPIQSYQGIPPQKRRDAEIMSDDQKRDFSANLIDTLVDALKMPRVESNAELADRIVAYLNLCILTAYRLCCAI